MSETRIPYMPMPPCPDCGSRDVVPIIYGLPGPELHDAARRGEAMLGGCVISDDNPQWSCRLCGRQFIGEGK